MMNAKFISVALLAVISMTAQTSSANLTAVSLMDFSGSHTVIDFNTINDAEFITNQYTGLGVQFSDALRGLADTHDEEDTELFNGSTIASNWRYSRPFGSAGPSWAATFSTTQNLVGFLVETKLGDDVTIEAFRDNGSLGSINFPNPNGDAIIDFIGIRDASGFDAIRVTTLKNPDTLNYPVNNGFFAMDDFRFESTGIIPTIPLPPIYAHLLPGLAMLAVVAHQRRNRPGQCQCAASFRSPHSDGPREPVTALFNVDEIERRRASAGAPEFDR